MPTNDNKPVNVNISRIPRDVGRGRLNDILLLFDNLDGHRPERDPVYFPIRTSDVFFVHIVNGWMRVMVNMVETRVDAGYVLSIMPNCVFQAIEASADMRFFCFTINEALHDQLLEKLGVHMALTERYARWFQTAVDEETTRISIDMYREILKEISLPDYPTKQLVVERYCEIMFLKCIYRFENKVDKNRFDGIPTRRVQIYRDFLALLETDFREHREISYYAERLCLTPKYLSTVVKEVSGKHGSKWIEDYVMLEAKVLLRQGHYNIKQISNMLNFPSQSMFGRFFKKNAGYSPKEYKQL